MTNPVAELMQSATSMMKCDYGNERLYIRMKINNHI